MAEPQARYVGAIDQGTTSTRFMVFDHDGAEVGRHQLEHEQILPQAGWVEHDATEVWERTQEVIRDGLRAAGIEATDLAAIGITNQRETTVVWDRRTGEPYHHAIVWQDTRTDAIAKQLERDGHGDLIRIRTACHRPPTSPAASCAGSSRTSTASGPTPRPGTPCSAPWTRGCCGSSPGCTSPTSPTRAARC